MLHKEIPFLRIGLPLCAGIISGLFFRPAASFICISLILTVIAFIISTFRNKTQVNTVFGLSVTYALFICGLVLYTIEKEQISILSPESALYSGTLSDYPVEKENSFLLTLRLQSTISGNKETPAGGTLLIYYTKESKPPMLLPGDILIIKCAPGQIRNRGNPNEFDYRFFMETQGIRYVAYIKNRDIIARVTPEHRSLKHNALIIREKLISMYRERGITGDRLALVAAIILGQKSMLDQDQKQSFIKAGIMHIMAVSGLHAGILSLFIFNLLFFMKNKLNILRILITIIILWAFAFVTGLTPSVLRATLMFSFLHTGNLLKRRVNGINSVLASAFFLILLKPSVIFEAGFLLSYAAVIFIISFYQSAYMKIVFKNWLADKIWQSAVITLIAQAGTLSLTIMLFNRFPTYFILTNIIIVPLSSLLIIVGSLVPLTYPVHFLSYPLAYALNQLTGLTEFLTVKAASLPLSSIENIGMTAVKCILLFLIIYSLILHFLRRQSVSVYLPVLLILIASAYGTISDISERRSDKLIVYNTPGSSTIGIKTGRVLNIYSDTSQISPAVLRHSATLGLNLNINLITGDFTSIRAGEKSIIISKSVKEYNDYDLSNKILILTGSKPGLNDLQFNKNIPQTLIMTSAAGFTQRFIETPYYSAVDTIHFVKKDGAFIKAL